MKKRLDMQSFCLILVVVWLSSLPALAQSGGIPEAASTQKPSPPWVASPPENAQWRITLRRPRTAGEADTKGQRLLQQVLCAKLGKMKRDILSYSDGFTEEYWYVNELALMPERTGSSEIMIAVMTAGGGSQGMFDPVNSRGFAGVEWIKGGDYRDTVQFMNVKCDHYVRNVEAWIDAKTKLPVAYQFEGSLYVYTFETPPASLVMPDAYQKVYDKFQKMEQHKRQLMHDLGGG